MGEASAAWPAVLLAGSIYYSLFGGWLDSVLLLAFSAWRNRDEFLELVDLKAVVPYLAALPGLIIGFSLFQILRYLVTGVDGPQWTGSGRPLLIPCKTTHRRLFPKQHAFEYSYLVVGIPVGWAGSAGGMVSAEVPTSRDVTSMLSLKPVRRRAWYDVDPGDYLERGSSHLGLRGKLDAYLRAQGADPATYPHAYLVTAARFLGYHFNPVSFWYLYSEQKQLTAMILEVNNTFDERRMYFLTPDSTPPDNQLSDTMTKDGEDSSQAGAASKGVPNKLRQSWPKDFHVSPFNSRKGSYSLLANDPLEPGMQGLCSIDNTITLKSSKDHPKLVARLVSAGSAIDPTAMGFAQKLGFLLGWWWVGFVTFPRIVKEAGRLFFRRKLHVWYRPEPLKESLGRMADGNEEKLESLFRNYLRHIVEQSPAAIKVKYVASGIVTANTEDMVSPAAAKNPKRAEYLEFKVLTPVFYARFIQYAHDFEAIFCELRESCTIWVSEPDLLPKIFLKKPAPTLRTTSGLDYAYFKAIQRLRQRPERIVRPLTSGEAPPATPAAQKSDIRDFRISSMDGYVLAKENGQSRKAYRSVVLQIFLADRLAFGSVGLLRLQQSVIRALVAWILSYSLDAVLLRLL